MAIIAIIVTPRGDPENAQHHPPELRETAQQSSIICKIAPQRACSCWGESYSMCTSFSLEELLFSALCSAVLDDAPYIQRIACLVETSGCLKN